MTGNGSRFALVVFLLLHCLVVRVGQANDSPLNDQALAFLENHTTEIVVEARKFADALPPALRSDAGRFPVLQSLGPVTLHMQMDEIRLLLGQAVSTEETETGWKWSYTRMKGKKLIVVFDLTKRVMQILSNAEEFVVPQKLSVGTWLDEFEKIYGSRFLRTSTPVSRQFKLVKYPFSNLALIVHTSTGVVYALMVFDNTSK